LNDPTVARRFRAEAVTIARLTAEVATESLPDQYVVIAR
jgi:hypothetical protein